MIEETNKLLQVEDLRMHFPVKGGVMMKQVGAVKAVDGVDFHIGSGEIRRVAPRIIPICELCNRSISPFWSFKRNASREDYSAL